MQFTNSVRTIANFAYTPASDIFLMYAEQSLVKKLLLYDFSTNPPTLIREYSNDLSESAHLVYVPGTNYFVSSNYGDIVFINARTGQVGNRPSVTGFLGAAGTIEKIFTYRNPTNQAEYIGFIE